MDIANSSVNNGPKWSIDSIFVGGFSETGEFTFIYVPCITIKFNLSIFCSDANPFLAGLTVPQSLHLEIPEIALTQSLMKVGSWPSCRVKQFH